MKIERFEDIESWQLGRELTKAVYVATNKGPFSKDHGLRDQIQRAAGSVMHNIAEGFDGGSNAEFVKFLRYAQRSASEVQSQLYVAADQGYISQDTFDHLYQMAAKTKKMLGGLIAYLIRCERK